MLRTLGSGIRFQKRFLLLFNAPKILRNATYVTTGTRGCTIVSSSSEKVTEKQNTNENSPPISQEKRETLVQMWRDHPPVAVAPANSSHTFRDTRPRPEGEEIETLRRRLIYQSRYRGMVEMDLICGHFARLKLPDLEAPLLLEYDSLLRQYDNDLFNWLVCGMTPPEDIQALKCFTILKEFVENNRNELLGHIL